MENSDGRTEEDCEGGVIGWEEKLQDVNGFVVVDVGND